MKKLLMCVALLGLTSCTKADLSVRSEYYNRQQLASFHVDTPDPKKMGDAFGQRLIIGWSVPEKTFQEAPLELELRVRLKNGEEKSSKIVLKKREGHTFYPIFGKDFTKKGGLQSYLVRLCSNEKILARSRHKLWVERIKIAE